ncbi:MAG: ThiF family adenylyltransferase, partial [Thiogranum sp.]
MSPSDSVERFSGIQRLYGTVAAEHVRAMHVCVIGIGGVGSWAVEALARSGAGALTLIDYDAICVTNINRQVHALDSSLGQKKTLVMSERVQEINPQCHCTVIDDFITDKNLFDYLPVESGFDAVIDA